jgi:hypothetical protein
MLMLMYDVPQIFWAFFHAGAWPYALPYAGLDPTVAAMAASAAGGLLISPWKFGRECAQKHMVHVPRGDSFE